MIQPIWETWSCRLPTHPLCCDIFADGVFRRSRETALKRQYVQFNNDAFVNWLVFDIDRGDLFEAWDRANLHAPNLYVQNPANGHGHLFYGLAQPVGTCETHRRNPAWASQAERCSIRPIGSRSGKRHKKSISVLATRHVSFIKVGAGIGTACSKRSEIIARHTRTTQERCRELTASDFALGGPEC